VGAWTNQQEDVMKHSALAVILAVLPLAVVGALCGSVLAESRLSDDWLPSADNARFAVIWGAVFGSIGAAAATALSLERPIKLRAMLVVCVLTLLFSGLTLYAFAVVTGSV
jgi:hypothetical protein